ncbi:cyclic nucleotide-gated channel rod photoreceptor subunit alpha-like isoform X2 [Mercenaria mercenaria]|uniref:cyclic nucleotide-gated channel rod photoreceptor subunit alpha-like isoform X2 n=1 Tax=Mercenaria mercenaria TaxID=6596 RepID=UPI00234F3AD8|nr:cyclic nucleotide-gated channel rod photoreceptor subunit alpha-like isoform X2 [Mercenaria mercenaria]
MNSLSQPGPGTFSFFVWLSDLWSYHFFYFINTDNFDRRIPEENADGDDKDEDDDGPSGFGQVDDDIESEEDPPEWEMGIRRSNQARSCRIEDLTLSDIILDPDGNITYYWLGIVTLAVVYNIAVIVLRLAFQEMRDPAIEDSVFYLLDTIGDLIYILDIFVHMRISHYEDGCLVLDPTKIMEKYKKSNKFQMALLAILPFGTVYKLISGFGSLLFLDYFFYMSGDIHIMLVRLPRLLKYPTMARFFDITDSRTRNPNLIRAFKLTLNLWVVIHWIGCAYYVVSEYEGLGSNSWVYPSGQEYSSFTRKYIRVMYWSLMTLTTIGERPPPETDLEFVFTGLTFLIGVFVFAAVVGNVGDVISNMNAARTEFQSRMDQIKSYLQHRHVDEKLQNRVKRWAEYTWKRTQSIDEPSLLQLLPDRLRTEIAINVHLETLKKVKIFEECEEGLLRELVLKLRPQVYSPGDFICRIGEVGKEMFIVNHGKVEILVPSQQNGRRTVVATLTPGNYFGEISLLKLDDGQNRRTADVKAVGYSELLRLSRKDLMSALVEYPNAKRILEQQAKERIEKTKEMRRASSQDESPQAVDTPSDDHPPGKKKDLLLKVIRSSNFRKLLSSRHSEMNELREVVDELRQFDSQVTKDIIHNLQQKNENLQTELNKRQKEVSVLKRKLSRSKEIKCNHESPTSSRKAISSNTDCESNTCQTSVKSVCNVDNSLDDHLCCIAQNTSPILCRSTLDKLQSRQRHRQVNHLPVCSLPSMGNNCKCRSLRHSSSTPDVYKGGNVPILRIKHGNLDIKPSRSDPTLTFQEHFQKDNFRNGNLSKSHSNGDCSGENCKTRNDDYKNENIQAEDHDLHEIETLLDLETCDLTDSSAHSTDHSSDEQSDIDFDLPEKS